jgi:hypothetical protein
VAIGNLATGVPSQVSASTVIKAAYGSLLSIFCSSSSSGTAAVYNSATAATNNKVVDTFSLTAATNYPINIDCSNGIYIVIGGTASVTAVYV